MPANAPVRAPGGFPVVGVIGGGQLARMMQAPAIALGVQLSVLAEAVDASAALVVPSAPVGDHADLEAVCRFAAACDVVTFDHEHVPADVLAALVSAGVMLQPSPEALVFAQDKLAMRRKLTELGVPCPEWVVAQTAEEASGFAARVGFPFIAKTPRGGYDGKGVQVVRQLSDLEAWLGAAATQVQAGTGALRDGILLEEMVPFVRELAVLVARSPSGQAAAWPVVQTIQTDGICTDVCAPAPGLDPEVAAAATRTALQIAGELGVTGVLAVEMFDLGVPPKGAGGDHPAYLVNELAMRPHNSGHWTIDGAVTSQFEQHLRAVLDLPLGDPRPHAAWTVMANVLGGDYPELYPAYRHVMARDPGVKVHMYGKGVRPGRKLGHVNVSGSSLEDCQARARHAADYLRGIIDE
ncbi:MAG: 5-(carboxyamino)imidazole ribonucleotide synthase [Dermatophilaceae bacterium]|nr:5-(carboxyamino)imidazole ribonucleotide synthase [Dermatophilaceae bacterium]